MTHRDYFKRYKLSVEQYGEILVAQALSGKKPHQIKAGYDFDGKVDGKKARIEVKSKFADTASGKASVIHCSDIKFSQGGMTHLAVVLVGNESEGNSKSEEGAVMEAWLITLDQAKSLRTNTKSKYIPVGSLRKIYDGKVFAESLNRVAIKKI